jgi:signal transduction histidine kinase
MRILPGGRGVALSIKTRVTLMVTTMLLGSLLLLSLVQLYHVKAHMNRVLADQQFSLAVRVADEIDQKLALHRDALVATADVLSRRWVEDAATMEALLAERTVLSTLFNDLFIHSAEGAVLVDLPPIPGRRGVDITDQDNFRTVIASRKPHISRPFRGKAQKLPVVTITAPIFDRQGELRALLAGSLSLLKPNFLGRLGEAKVGQTGSFAIFTRDRMIVMSREKDRILTEGPPPGASPYFDRATSGLEGSEEGINSRGLRAIFSYSQLETVPWVLVAALPVDEAYAPIQATQRKIMQVAVLLALLAAPLIWFGVRQLLDPLQMLRDTIRNVRDNPAAAHDVPVRSTDEIGDLAADFNEMRHSRRRANEELQAKNAELAQALNAKDRFLATMSHELRTPLNAILGFAGTLLMHLPGPLNADQERQLKTVQTSARHLLALINDLLDLAKLNAGKVELRLEPVACRSVLEEAMIALRPLAQAKGLQLDLYGAEVTVQSDRRALRQIVVNLLGNAIKFTERGSVRLEALRHEGAVEMRVSDTGVGIRPEDQGKLFDAFARVDDAATREKEGSGLGLHLSQRLAELLGGRISVQSEYGRGSTFTLRLADA